MPTVTNTIGTTGRDYSTIALWEAALPANLVTDGNSYVGACYNDSEFVVTSAVTFAGSTTDATHTITLTAAAGQSFIDNASVQTNALQYNVSNGVGLLINTGGAAHAILVSEANVFITRFQVKGGDSVTSAIIQSGSTLNLSQCIVSQSDGCTGFVMNPAAGPYSFLNCAFISGANTSGAIIATGTGNAANCTLVRYSDSSGSQVALSTFGIATNITFVNCAFFGWSATADSSVNTGGNNCATDNASFTGTFTSSLVSKTYANQFVNTTIASADFKTKTAADLLDAGSTDTTDIPGAIDIVDTSRPQGSAWDIGAWELKTVATTTPKPTNLPLLGVG